MKLIKKIMRHAPHDMRRALFKISEPDKYKNLQEKRKHIDTEYSYHPFDVTKSIFVHIPKAAGLSVCSAVYGGKAGGHTPISIYQLVFSKREFSSYWKFTVVRNPWDRLFSAYSFLKDGGINENDRNFSDTVLNKYKSFEEFVIEWASTYNINKYLHFMPQLYFLKSYDSNDLLVDYICHYETLEQDFDEVRKKLNIKTNLQHINKTKNHNYNYRSKYTIEMIDIVGNLYAQDIFALHYEF